MPVADDRSSENGGVDKPRAAWEASSHRVHNPSAGGRLPKLPRSEHIAQTSFWLTRRGIVNQTVTNRSLQPFQPA